MSEETVKTAETSRNPFLEAPNAKKMMVVVGVYLGVIANLMVSTSNSIVLPAAAAEIGGQDIYALAQSVAGIIGVCAMPIFGFIAARNPAMKRLLAGGSLAIGALVILVRVIAWNMWMIIIASTLWGLVSAGVFAVGFTMIRDVYDREKAGLYLGLVGTMMSIALIAGPFLAGAVVGALGWRFFCGVLFVILAAAAASILFSIRVKAEEAAHLGRKGGKFDFVGALFVTVFLGCLIIALSMGSSYVKFGTPLSFALLGISLVAMVCLIVVIAKKKDDAIVPLAALKNRNVVVLACSNALHNFGSMSISFFIAGFIMRTLAQDPLCVALGPSLAAGIASALMGVLGLVLSPIFGKMIAKTGDAKTVMTIGNVARILVMGAFAFTLSASTPVWLIMVLMFLAGIFNSQQTVTQSAAPQILLSQTMRTVGNSVIQLGQNIGAGLGMAVFTLLVAADPVAGMHNCMMVALGSWVILFFITFLLKKAEDQQD